MVFLSDTMCKNTKLELKYIPNDIEKLNIG